METLYPSWTHSDHYHLTTLTGSASSSSTSNSGQHQHFNTSSSSSSSSPTSTSSSSVAPMAATSYLVPCDTNTSASVTPLSDSIVLNSSNGVLLDNNSNIDMFYSPTQPPPQPLPSLPPLQPPPSLQTTNFETMTNTNNMSDLIFDYQQANNCVHHHYNGGISGEYYNHNGTDIGQSPFPNHNNYSISTSIKSPSYSSPSLSPDLIWEKYGLTENVKNQQTGNSNSDQSNLQHSHFINHHEHQHNPMVTNYQNQYENNNDNDNDNDNDNVSAYTINDNAITNTKSNNITIINTTINNIKVNHVNTKNTINPIKSTISRGSYKVKKVDSNNIKNENVSSNVHSKNGQHHKSNHLHHRSIGYRERGERGGEGSGNESKYLSPEDEERRRRRRERNKVAATKCRNKKKVHVYKLCQESQILESTNLDLKEEMQNLKREEKRLNEILIKHLPFCVRRALQPISDSINM